MSSFDCQLPAECDSIDSPGAGAPAPPASDDERRLRSARATQRITVLGEMTAGLAHDFRNILAVIQSGLSLAERFRDDPEKLSRVNIDTMLRCLIDPTLFNAAILNLVVNARDAMPDGGEIRIATSLISLSESDDAGDDLFCVVVRIIDPGAGMTEVVRDRIFDPYFTTKGETGTGLGLPQVVSFMRASGGCLNVNSEPGAGTSFDLYFPVCDSPGLIGTSLWRQLDRWSNEGGSPDPAGRPASPLRGIAAPAASPSTPVFFTARPSEPLAQPAFSGTDPAARDQ